MKTILSSVLLATLATLGTAHAQWVDGELIVQAPLPSTALALIRVDPATGNSSILVSGHGRVGHAGACAFDPYRNALIANISLPPDPYGLGKLWALQSDGTGSSLGGLSGVTLRGICSAGDGRIFYQVHNGTNAIQWIDAANAVHTLLDASGTAPFLFSYEHAVWHPTTNSLLVTNSGWWSTNHCGPASCSIFRIPLSPDGSRVAGAPLCASFATGNNEVMGLDYMPGGDLLVTVADGAFTGTPKLVRINPVTLAVSPFATPQMGNLDGGCYSATIGRAIVLDDGANVLRTFAPGQSGIGAVLSTTMPVGDFTSGYSPSENVWEIDLNGPSCQGLALSYGAGLAGTGGIVPSLAVVGCPDSNQPFSIVVDHLVGGTIGLLVFGGAPASFPAFGGTIHAVPESSFVLLGTGAVGVAGAGSATLPVTITDPALVGVPVFLQGAFLDDGAIEDWSLTNGLQLVIG